MCPSVASISTVLIGVLYVFLPSQVDPVSVSYRIALVSSDGTEETGSSLSQRTLHLLALPCGAFYYSF